MQLFTSNYISITKRLCDNLNLLGLNNKMDHLMIVGAKTNGDSVVIDQSTLKWFNEKELSPFNDEPDAIDINLLVDTMCKVTTNGNDSLIMFHIHPCNTEKEDFMYGSMTETDLKYSRQLYLLCNFKNLKLFDGVITGNHIYFWTIDNEYYKPIKVDCYVDKKKITNMVPSTIKELVDIVKKS